LFTISHGSAHLTPLNKSIVNSVNIHRVLRNTWPNIRPIASGISILPAWKNKKKGNGKNCRPRSKLAKYLSSISNKPNMNNKINTNIKVKAQYNEASNNRHGRIKAKNCNHY